MPACGPTLVELIEFLLGYVTAHDFLTDGHMFGGVKVEAYQVVYVLGYRT